MRNSNQEKLPMVALSASDFKKAEIIINHIRMIESEKAFEELDRVLLGLGSQKVRYYTYETPFITTSAPSIGSQYVGAMFMGTPSFVELCKAVEANKQLNKDVCVSLDTYQNLVDYKPEIEKKSYVLDFGSWGFVAVSVLFMTVFALLWVASFALG